MNALELALGWKVGAIGGLVLVLWLVLAPQAFSVGQVVVAGLGIVLSAFAPRFPLLMGGAYVLLFLLISYDESLRTALVVLWAVVLVALVAVVKGWRKSLALAVVLSYVATTSVFVGIWLPIDFVGAGIMMCLFAAGVWVGTMLQQARLRQEEERARLERESENHRDALMRTLHDSVANKLTSVVLRAESLGLGSDAPQLRETTDLIADEAREAISEVRRLIQVMRDGDEIAPVAVARTVEEHGQLVAELLGSHGFEVELEIPAKVADRELPGNFQQVFAELSANIVKYARPGSTVHFQARISGTTKRDLELDLANELGERQSAAHLTTGLGLGDVEKHCVEAGGNVAWRVDEGRWRVQITLPKYY